MEGLVAETQPSLHIEMTLPDTGLKTLVEPKVIEMPTDPEIERSLINAQAMMQQKEFALAQSLLRKVFHSDPKNLTAMKLLSQCSIRTAQYDFALKCLKQAYKIEASPQIELALAEAHHLKGDDQEALKYYFRALPRCDFDLRTFFEAYKNMGNIFLRLGDLEGAEENYDRAHTLVGDSDTLLTNYGTLEIQKGDLGRAAERFRQAIQVNSANDKAWIGLALVHRQMSDFELAWANLERALDLDPYNRSALMIYVEWAIADHRLDLLIQHIQDYFIKNPTDAEMSFILAKVYFIKGNFSEARLEVTRVMALEPALQGLDEFVRILETEENKRNEIEK